MTGGERAPALTELQHQVVDSPSGRLVFLAGAGAGKTLAAGERLVRLARFYQRHGGRILLLAPSRRAALGPYNYAQSRIHFTAPITVDSFYGLALAILTRHHHLAEYRHPPQILTSAQLFDALRLSLAEEDPRLWPYLQDLLGSSVVRRLVHDIVLGATENALDHRELQRRAKNWGSPELVEMIGFVERFRTRQEREGNLNQSEALARVVDLLSCHQTVAEHYHRRYRHILVDEFEEASYLQGELLYRLLGDDTDVLVAGDPGQSIHSFRSGSPAHLISCADRLGANVIVSSENHRSGSRLARVVRALRPADDAAVSLAHWATERTDGIKREPSASRTPADDPPIDPVDSKTSSTEVSVRAASPTAEALTAAFKEDHSYVVLRSFTYPAEQARWVSAEIARLIYSGTPPTEMAVLLRSYGSPITPSLFAELDRRQIPYQAHESRGILREPLLGATVNLLRYLWSVSMAPKDAPAEERGRLERSLDSGSTGILVAQTEQIDQLFIRVLESPLGDLPPFGLAELSRAATQAGLGLANLSLDNIGDLVLSEGTRQALSGFLQRLASLRAKAHLEAPRILWEIWRAFPAFASDALATRSAAVAYAAWLDEIGRLAEERSFGLADLIDRLEDGYFDTLRSAPRGGQGITIATVHQARGKEWSVVFLPDLIEDVYPLKRSPQDLQPFLARDLPDTPHSKGTSGTAEMAFRRQRLQSDEERRIFYVAVSRARNGLYLSYCHRSTDGTSAALPSRFLTALTDSAEIEVVTGDTDSDPPLDLDGAVVHYRCLLGSGNPLLQAQGVYGIDRIRHIWPDKVRPHEWWGLIDETSGAEPPFADGRLHLSASRLNQFRRCPRAYQFRYHWRLDDAETPALTVGKLLHAALEEYHHPNSALPRTREALQEFLQRHFDPSAFRYRPIAEQRRRNLEKMLDAYFNRYGQIDSPIAVEQSFRFSLGPHRISGVIDRIDRRTDGGIELIDYKTGSAMSYADALIDLQLALYELAFHHNTELALLGQPTRAVYLYLKNIGPRADGQRAYTPTAESRQFLVDRVRYYTEAILAERFPTQPAMAIEFVDLHPTELQWVFRQSPCRSCVFRWICPETERGASDE